MKDKDSIINIAKQTIEIESKAILNLTNLVNNDFAEAVELIYNSKGRVIITGVGKSAIITTRPLELLQH